MRQRRDTRQKEEVPKREEESSGSFHPTDLFLGIKIRII